MLVIVPTVFLVDICTTFERWHCIGWGGGGGGQDTWNQILSS